MRRKKESKRGKPKRKKTKKLKIHKREILEPTEVPKGSKFKGYEYYTVQDLKFESHNIQYARARYLTPDGKTILGELPESVKGSHFGANLKGWIVSQHYENRVPQHLILKQLTDIGIQISSGQINNILTEEVDLFHEEKAEVLEAGLEVSDYIGVDDTGARHKGKNGYCTAIGNELFTWFSSTESKSRVNFLELLRTRHTRYIIDDEARQYLSSTKMPKSIQLLFSSQQHCFEDERAWLSYLANLGITAQRHIKFATEAALVASLIEQGVSTELVILSDDAGQFEVSTFLNALCWVHAERHIKKIIPFSETNREAQAMVREQIWDFYQKLKEYKLSPSQLQAKLLEEEFNRIFKQKTCFQSLNLALERLYQNKKALLLVLHKPSVPLHNNLRENDIREYVIKRKISATTRSDPGRDARDSFLSIKKTCTKLGISFFHYLIDRFSLKNEIPPLKVLIRDKAAAI